MIKRLATPKKQIEVPPPYRKKKPLSSFRRLGKLAAHKKYTSHEPVAWKFTLGMKQYKASKRLKEIAAHADKEDVHYRALPIKIPQSALKYKISERTKALAAVAEKKGTASDLKDQPFLISENALKAKASARTKELAEPKEYTETPPRNQKISEAALKAKASPRTCELAKERRRTEKYVDPNKKA